MRLRGAGITRARTNRAMETKIAVMLIMASSDKPSFPWASPLSAKLFLGSPRVLQIIGRPLAETVMVRRSSAMLSGYAMFKIVRLPLGSPQPRSRDQYKRS